MNEKTYVDVMSPDRFLSPLIPTSSYSIYRDYTEDGVIGLNGKQFLLDDNDETMEFPSIADAIQFLEDNGVDIIDDDLMHIVASDDETFECVVDHFFEHKNCIGEDNA